MRAFRSAAVLLACAISSFAQESPSTSTGTAFEVASVKPNRSGATNSSSNTRPGGSYVAD